MQLLCFYSQPNFWQLWISKLSLHVKY
jgi:hypothetical protein